MMLHVHDDIADVSVEHAQYMYMYIHQKKTIRQFNDRALCSPIGPI